LSTISRSWSWCSTRGVSEPVGGGAAGAGLGTAAVPSARLSGSVTTMPGPSRRSCRARLPSTRIVPRRSSLKMPASGTLGSSLRR